MTKSFNIRQATEADVHEIAHVHVLSWHQSYLDLIPIEEISTFSYKQRVDYHQEIISKKELFHHVAVVGNEIVGFCIAGKPKNNIPDVKGEIHTIYLIKPHQGKGIGEALLASALGWLENHSMMPAMVWTDLRNEPAGKFYKKHGWIFSGEHTEYDELMGIERTQVFFIRRKK